MATAALTEKTPSSDYLNLYRAVDVAVADVEADAAAEAAVVVAAPIAPTVLVNAGPAS